MARGRPSKRQHILETAQMLFSQLGYQGTSIDLVVREAGVSKPTVYNNFPSKQSLLQALVVQSCVELEAALSVTCEGSLSHRLLRDFTTVSSSAFYRAIYRIYYGEQHKLDQITLEAIMAFDQLLSSTTRQVMQDSKFDLTQIDFIEALCREKILMASLKQQSILSAAQLSDYLKQLTQRSEAL